MDDVKRQLHLHVMAALLGLVPRNLDAEHELARQLACGAVAQRKRQHIGRLVVIEEALVEAMNGRVIHEGEADLVVRHALAVEHCPPDCAHAPAIDGNDFLRARDGDLAHGAH